jgi:hypothetical protein
VKETCRASVGSPIWLCRRFAGDDQLVLVIPVSAAYARGIEGVESSRGAGRRAVTEAMRVCG